jgi:hypothetical protein
MGSLLERTGASTGWKRQTNSWAGTPWTQDLSRASLSRSTVTSWVQEPMRPRWVLRLKDWGGRMAANPFSSLLVASSRGPGIPNRPLPGIAGARLGSLQNPAKTVLVAEGSAFEGFSWHKPHKELLFRDSLNEVGYVDGHVDFVKIFWNGSLAATGAACFYDPPQGYAYAWSGK